jgi:vacuolar-type H+-ATPase subunit I/STV1
VDGIPMRLTAILALLMAIVGCNSDNERLLKKVGELEQKEGSLRKQINELEAKLHRKQEDDTKVLKAEKDVISALRGQLEEEYQDDPQRKQIVEGTKITADLLVSRRFKMNDLQWLLVAGTFRIVHPKLPKRKQEPDETDTSVLLLRMEEGKWVVADTMFIE